MRRLCLIAVLTGLAGCEREMAPAICPPAGDNDLVITEVRGGKAADEWGQWIEVYNASGAPMELHGLGVVLRTIDGRDQGVVRVRRPLALAAGDYAVLGRFADDARPAHVDYGWGTDFLGADGEPKNLFDNAAIDLEACDVRIDRIVHDALPNPGSYSFGVMPPDGTSNDAKTAWCTDAVADGLPGTPGAANAPCM